jgi:hypothetical protein
VSTPVDELIERLRSSVGTPLVEESTGLAPSQPTESWVDLQAAVVALADQLDGDARRDLAAALLHAVLYQPSFGPSNRLSTDAFALLLGAIPDELAASLGGPSLADPVAAVSELYGGKRYLQQHVWAIPGSEGARWLGVLARADDIRANFLLQDMASGQVPMWPDEDWPDRLDALAALPPEPRPGVVSMLFLLRPPRAALPALVRVALVHGEDERDHLFRFCAERLREQRRSADDVAGLVDWEAGQRRPELFRWLLELSGVAGEREQVVAAAVADGRLAGNDAALFSAPLERPAWADGEVPWEVERVVLAGELRLPEGRLAGGDPWWTGGVEGFPWVIEVPSGSFSVHVVVASHPLYGRECAALELVLDAETPVDRWTLVPSERRGEDGYHVEVGVASLGADTAYDAQVSLEGADEFFTREHPAWSTLDGGSAGTIVYCTVGPQHQLCRTWLGTASGAPAAVVTDLGLVDVDLAADPRRPW